MYSALTGGGHYGFDQLRFSVYMGWVTIAAIVSIFTLAVNNDVETLIGLNELSWTIIRLIFSALVLLAAAATAVIRWSRRGTWQKKAPDNNSGAFLISSFQLQVGQACAVPFKSGELIAAFFTVI